MSNEFVLQSLYQHFLIQGLDALLQQTRDRATIGRDWNLIGWMSLTGLRV